MCVGRWGGLPRGVGLHCCTEDKEENWSEEIVQGTAKYHVQNVI